jgi:hypothetical protein
MRLRFKSMRHRGVTASSTHASEDTLHALTALGILLMLGGLAFTLLLMHP